MKSFIHKISILLFICVLYSCDQHKNPYFETIFKTGKGHLRGVEIGSSLKKVKSMEDPKFLKDEMPDYLHYDYTLDMGNSYTVTYDFSQEDQLYGIELAVFFDVIEDANTLFEDFSDHFNKKYGKGKKEEDGYTIWKTKSNQLAGNVEIAMINDSQTYGYISIIIRDLDY